MGVQSLTELRGQLNATQRAKLMRQLIESEAACEPATTILARDALWTSIVEFPAFDEQEFRARLETEFDADDVELFMELSHAAESDSEVASADQQQTYSDASDRSLAYQRLLVVQLGIERYREVHADPPPDLAALVPKFLLARMPDPFTNADFVYRVENGEPVLYSVGAKRRDLGGVRGEWPDAAVGLADMFLE